MKRIIVLITGCFLILYAFELKSGEGDNKWKDKYCAVVKNGELTMMNGNTELMVNVTLDNGSTVTTDGYVIGRDGTKTTLHNGDCVDKAGNIIPGKKNRNNSTK